MKSVMTLILVFSSLSVFALDLNLAQGTSFMTKWYSYWDMVSDETHGAAAQAWLLSNVSKQDLHMTYSKLVNTKVEFAAFLKFLADTKTTSQHEVLAMKKIDHRTFQFVVRFYSQSSSRPDLNGSCLINVRFTEDGTEKLMIDRYEITKMISPNSKIDLLLEEK